MKIQSPTGAGSSSVLPHAGELFTDRVSESEAFKLSLAAFRRALDSDQEVGMARHNVLTYYGMGGIGKTAISERMDAWVRYRLALDNGWGPPPATKVDATARIDLHSSGGQLDMLSILLALRQGISRLQRRWPAFDLAFAAYWSAVRPGEPTPTFQGSNGIVRTIDETVQELAAEVGSIVLPAGADTAVRGVRALISQAQRRQELKDVAGAFDGYEMFLLRCVDEPSPSDPRPQIIFDLASALGWELAKGTPHPLVVVFVDATERLRIDPRRVAEAQLNALVHRLPNVLFVMTGREMVDWWDEARVDLPHRGSWVWPSLAPGATSEPRQHLVGDLSPTDTKAVVLRGRRLLDLPIDDDVVDELVRASAGLPQYLELARQVAVSIRESGGQRRVRTSDVTGSIDSLVLRVLDDVPPEEQLAIRAACLFRTFDSALVAAAAGVDHGTAERAVRRPMIDHYEGERFPYRMHDAVRAAIREADHRIPGGWSGRDWELASARAAEAAHQLHDIAAGRGQNREMLDAIGLAVTLVCDQSTELAAAPQSTYADWLSRAIVFGPSIQALSTRIPARSLTIYGQHVLDFVAGKVITNPYEQRLTKLRSVFESDHPLQASAGRHLGYALRTGRRWDEALAVFDELAAVMPTAVNVRQRAITLSLARRMADAVAAAASRDDIIYLTRVAEYAHGRPARYFNEVTEKLDRLRAVGRQREVIEEEGDLLFRRVLIRGDVTEVELAEYGERVEVIGHVVGIRSALVAAVLHGTLSSGERDLALKRLRHLEQQTDPQQRIGFRYAVAEFCDAVLHQSRPRLVALRSEIVEIEGRSRSWIPLECFFEGVGLALPPIQTQWLEPYSTVRERWIEHLDGLLSRRNTSRAAVIVGG